jgi:hypothetical protein
MPQPRVATAEELAAPDVGAIEHRAFLESEDYDAPDDVLGPLMAEKIRAQQLPDERESFSTFWAELLKADPDEEKKTAKIVKRAIEREQARE